MRACLHRLNHVLYSTFIQRCTVRRPDPFVGTCLLDISQFASHFSKPVLLSHHLALLLTRPPRPFQSRIGRTKGLAVARLPGSTASFDAYYRIHRNYGAFGTRVPSTGRLTVLSQLLSNLPDFIDLSFSLNQYRFIAVPWTSFPSQPRTSLCLGLPRW